MLVHTFVALHHRRLCMCSEMERKCEMKQTQDTATLNLLDCHTWIIVFGPFFPVLRYSGVFTQRYNGTMFPETNRTHMVFEHTITDDCVCGKLCEFNVNVTSYCRRPTTTTTFNVSQKLKLYVALLGDTSRVRAIQCHLRICLCHTVTASHTHTPHA